MSVEQIGIFIVVFFLLYAIVKALPAFWQTYAERSRIALRISTRELDKFFISIKPTTIILSMAAVATVLGIITRSWVLAAALAVAGLFAPKLLLAVWKDIRSRKFDAQLMDALLLMGNTLKSGMDMAAGVERVASDMKPPISEEFGLVLNAYRLGTPIEAGLLDLTERINSRNLETAVYAIAIQRESGGNITKIFDQLVLNIREESKLQKKVRAITSQGRTQIFFLAVFPWALAGIFVLMAPEFMKPALANPWGQLVLVGLVVWEIIGIVVTKKLVTVNV
jgi:tight adherence protein B